MRYINDINDCEHPSNDGEFTSGNAPKSYHAARIKLLPSLIAYTECDAAHTNTMHSTE